MKTYGKELILDLHGCMPETFNRYSIKKFFDYLCIKIDMQQCDMHFWDYEGDPEGWENAPDHLKGVSAIQFITTSNITIHTLYELKRVYLNIFSCKDFDSELVIQICRSHFGGEIKTSVTIDRI